MTSRDFAYWLQGYFEISNPINIGPDQTEMIKKHLALVFKHEIDPSMGDEKHQEDLNNIHSGPDLEHYTKPPFNQPDGEILYRC